MTDREEGKTTSHPAPVFPREYRDLLESIPDMITSIEYPSGRVLYVNRAVKKILGYEPSQFYKSNLLMRIIVQDYRKDILRMWRSLKDGRDFPVVIYRVKKKDGSFIWAEQKNSLERDPDGRIIALNAIIRDITERKTMEEEAFRSLYFSENLFLHAPYIIVHLDESGFVKRINRAYEDFWETSLDDLKGYCIWKDRRIKDIGAFEILREVLKGNVMDIPPLVYEYTYRNVHRKVFLSGKAFPYLDEARRPSGIILMIEDVTARVRREEEYLEARKLESIGRLAGGIAHDFNNILAGILGFSEILIRKIDRDDGRLHFVSKIHEAATKAASLTNQLLGFARRGKYNPDYIDITSPIMFGLGATPGLHQGIRIEKEFLKADCKVFADPHQLRQVFIELFKNAIEAIRGEGVIRVKSEFIRQDELPEEREGARGNIFARITIADSGTGIPDDVFSRVFEPYFTTKEPARHAGMGLSIAYGIIKNHGGMIKLERPAGGGTEVLLYIPAVEKPPVLPRRDEKKYDRVLIIDDSEETRSVLRTFMEERGCVIQETASGRAGLELFRRNEIGFNLIFLDLIIPDITGREVLKAIRKSHPDIRIILISGHNPESILQDYMEDPNISVLLKPFSLEEIEAIL